MNEVAPVEPAQLPVVAHQGMLELLDASWGLTDGRQVKFRLVEGPGELGVHPFKHFTRRRGGRVGTRFHVVFVHVDSEKQFDTMEVMLAGGGEPLGQGQWVKFWLDDESSNHPFAGYRGRGKDKPGDIFGAAFVEVADDDEPVDQEKRARLEHGTRRKQHLSQFAALLSTNQNFLQYLTEKAEVEGILRPAQWWEADDHVARWIRWVCQISSRSELDTNEKAARIFHEKVRKPFNDWYGVSGDG